LIGFIALIVAALIVLLAWYLVATKIFFCAMHSVHYGTS